MYSCTVQALRVCTGYKAHRGSRCIALFFLDHYTGRCERSALRAGRSSPPAKPDTHCVHMNKRKLKNILFLSDAATYILLILFLYLIR